MRTAYARAMGYSSTAQLSATLDGEALISTKAVIELVKNFNVNPTYLFTGQDPTPPQCDLSFICQPPQDVGWFLISSRAFR